MFQESTKLYRQAQEQYVQIRNATTTITSTIIIITIIIIITTIINFIAIITTNATPIRKSFPQILLSPL